MAGLIPVLEVTVWQIVDGIMVVVFAASAIILGR